jgi:glycosyltransferase involved in cell wall biosynthesis
MEHPKLSVVIITLNEEKNIRRCLHSITFADEIIVVDSGSTDNTCSFAREYTDHVIFHEMHGFGEQKQFAVEQATGDWILSLDADEWASSELRESILLVLEKHPSDLPYAGYKIFRRNIYLGRAMKHCGWYVPILRLFRRDHGQFNNKLVHEEIIVNGSVGMINGVIMHQPYRSLIHHIEKMQHYANLDAHELIKRGRNVRGWQATIHLALRPLWKFTEKFFLQQGFREGIHGFILAVMAAYGVFLIHARCWELQKSQ